MKSVKPARIKSIVSKVARITISAVIGFITIGSAIVLNIAFPEATFAADISTQVSASAKDISQVYATMAFDNTVVSHYFGKNAAGTQISSAMVFTGITIPAGCYIYQAYITFKADATLSTSMTAAPPVIWGEDAAAPADYGAAEDFTIRTYTTASVSWTPASWVLNTSYNTPDLTTIVQELYDTHGPYAAGSMAFEVLGTAGTASAAYRSAYSYDCGTPANAPILVIEYAPLTAYWVGGTGGMHDAGSHWALSSGGTPNAAYLPNTGTNAIWDEHSNEPTDGSYSVTNAAAMTMTYHDLTFSNPPSGVVTYNGGGSGASYYHYVYGSITLASGMSWLGTNNYYFYSSGAETITSNGCAWGNAINFNNAIGSWTLQDAFSQSRANYSITVENGTFDTNGKTVSFTVGGNISVSAGGTLTCGSSIIDVATGGGSITISGVLNANTATISCVGWTATGTINAGTSTITASFDFAGGGKTYNDVVLTGPAYQLTGINTFADLTFTGYDATTNEPIITANQTVTGTLTFNGYSASRRLRIFSSVLHTQRTFTAANVVADNTLFRDIIGAGADDWDFDAQTDIGDCGGNTNIEFPASINVYAVGGTGNYNFSTPTKWASTSGGVGGSGRVPLPQDIAVYDSHSFAIPGCIVTFDISHLPGINTLNVTNQPQFDGTTDYFYNSMMLDGALWNVTTSTYMYGQGLNYLSGDFSTGTCDLYIDSQTGSVDQTGDLTVASANTIYLTSGVWVTNDYAITAGLFNSATTTYTRAFWMDDSIITLNATSGTKWNVNATNMNIDAETSTIIFTNSTAGACTFTGGGMTYHDFTIQGSGNYSTTIGGTNTFARFTVDRSLANKTVTGSVTMTVTELSMPITGTNTVTITNTDFTMAAGVFCTDYLVLSGSSAGGGATYFAGSHATNNGGNAGWTFGGCTFPAVTTLAATDITDVSAVGHGNLTSLGSFGSVCCFFQYDQDGTFTVPGSTTEQTLSGIGTFLDTLTPLVANKAYFVRAVVRYNFTSYVYGSAVGFNTYDTGSGNIPGYDPTDGVSTLPKGGTTSGLGIDDISSDALETTTTTDWNTLSDCNDLDTLPGYDIIHATAEALTGTTMGYDLCKTEMMIWYGATGIFVLVVCIGLLLAIPGHILVSAIGTLAAVGLAVSVKIFPGWSIGIAVIYVIAALQQERTNWTG